jgi:hypothetical protein
LGSSVSIFSFGSIDILIVSSFCLGLLFAAILIKFLIDHFKSIVLVKSNFDFIISGLLFILLTMLVYSIGRANERPELVFESRYAITMTVGLCLICLLLYDKLSGNRILKYILLFMSISFCFLSYTSKLLDSVNFNNVVTANFIKHDLQHREHYFYKSNQDKKVDLANPIISKDYLLPKPKVSLSTSIVGSMIYLNEVIDISFSHQYVKLDPKLDAISRFLISDFSTPLPKEKNHITDFNIATKDNVIFYHNENAKTVISTKRPQVHWKYIVFDYNQHQIEDAKKLSQGLGIKNFKVVLSDRWWKQDLMPDKKYVNDLYAHQIAVTNGLDEPMLIKQKCIVDGKASRALYIDSEGDFYPCCKTGLYAFRYKTIFSPKTKKYNIKNNTIEQILEDTQVKQFFESTKSYATADKCCKIYCGVKNG